MIPPNKGDVIRRIKLLQSFDKHPDRMRLLLDCGHYIVTHFDIGFTCFRVEGLGDNLTVCHICTKLKKYG